LYSSCCCILNSSNSLSVFFVFLFSSSTYSMRLAELFYLATSCSRNILYTNVSAFFKKKSVIADLGVDLAMGDAKDRGNNINTCHWFIPISNKFCSYSFYSFLWNSSSKH
jgi:hypothetical protein